MHRYRAVAVRVLHTRVYSGYETRVALHSPVLDEALRLTLVSFFFPLLELPFTLAFSIVGCSLRGHYTRRLVSRFASRFFYTLDATVMHHRWVPDDTMLSATRIPSEKRQNANLRNPQSHCLDWMTIDHHIRDYVSLVTSSK